LARQSLSSLRLWDVDSVLTQNNHLFEEPSPFERISLDLDEPNIKKLSAIVQRLSVDLDLAVEILLAAIQSLDFHMGNWVTIRVGQNRG
jgi:hypothetical protein